MCREQERSSRGWTPDILCRTEHSLLISNRLLRRLERVFDFRHFRVHSIGASRGVQTAMFPKTVV